MSFIKTRKQLTIPAIPPVPPSVVGVEAVVLPAIFRRIGGGRGDGVFLNSSVTHTATVPRNARLVNNLIISDEEYQYRIIEVMEILGKFRLRLQRI